MDKPDHFEHAAGYACYRPAGKVSLQKAVSLVSLAISYARQQDIKLLMVDVTGFTGFDSPTTLERFSFGGQFALAAQGAVKLALVAKAEWIDPNRFGLTVARNRGLIGEVFTNEADALAWLLESAAP